MNIRLCKENDSEQFLKLLETLDKESEFMLYEPEERKTSIEQMHEIIKQKEKKASVLFVVEEDGNIIGFLSADKGQVNRNKHTAYIVIGILKDYYNKGIGTQLFNKLDNWAINNNIKRLELSVMTHNTRAINLYKKMGFKVEGTKKYSLRINNKYVDEYYMAKIIL